MLQRRIIATVIVGLTVLGTSTLASAALPGFYAGVQGGWGDTHYDPLNSTGLAGRISAGYQFDQNFATEVGYTQFPDATGPGGKLQQYAVDLVGKGILPLANNFSAFAKLGAAYVNGTAKPIGGSDINKDTIFPTFGAGFSYDLTPNVPVSVGWDRIQKVGGNDIKSTDFFYAGVAYNFG